MAFGTPTADNWSGGDNASSGLTYSVGGTASGLTGPVVLENNGGDALTVSADGSFTFPTQLASGAAYNVTVQANPTGQTCTVANGSGSIASADVSNVSVTCTTNASGTATDDFNRANGSLGPNWTDMSDGGLAISSQQVVGTSSGASGDIRTGENYASDQYSQIEITSTQLSGGQWVGAAVRAQNGGQNDLPRPVLLERRRPRLDAVQAPQRRVDPARLDLRQWRTRLPAPSWSSSARARTSPS